MIDVKVLFDRLPDEIERLHACSTEPGLAEDRSKLVITGDYRCYPAALQAMLSHRIHPVA